MKIKHAQNLINFINESTCNFLATHTIKNRLLEEGFIELKQDKDWDLKPFGKYFFVKNNSSLISFIIGEDILENGFKIIASHIDSPTFILKPNCEVNTLKKYLTLNTEGYGGMILYSWLDRPLGLSGRVVLTGDNIFEPREEIVDFKRPLLIIPSLAIHLNRSINDGFKFSKQTHMSPILTLTGEDFDEKDFLYKLISEELNVSKEEILDYELSLYEYEKGSIIGANNDFISCGRLDDLMMAYNSLESFINESKNTVQKGIKVVFFADNEEVGSNTSQGADSFLLRDVLYRIATNLFKDENAFHKILGKTFAISADLGHAVHPSYIDKHDTTNRNLMGEGVLCKYSSNKKYATNSVSSAVFRSLCEKANVKGQNFVNHSDAIAGSTIGPMISSELNVPVLDMGVSILAMHSIRELASVEDNFDCFKLFCEFYKN